MRRVRKPPEWIDLGGDIDMERACIGAVLIAPLRLRPYMGELRGADFAHDWLGWLWERLRYAVLAKGIADRLVEWVAKDGWRETFTRRFGLRLAEELARCLRACWWWHGVWYFEQVSEAGKRRQRVVDAAAEFRVALGELTAEQKAVVRADRRGK